MAEEDTRWKPLADAISMAEDQVISTLQFRDQNATDKFRNMVCLFDLGQYQHIGLQQLASRVSDKMLRALVAAVQDLADSDPNGRYKNFTDDWLEWLRSLEKERDKQIVSFFSVH